MSIYTPYFYIIKHIPSNKYYAGYKSKNANPSTFMTEDGYQTSSPKIHKLIRLNGLSSFEIIDIILEDEILIPFGWSSIYQFETWFLRFHNCAQSSNWINSHNNHSIFGLPDITNKLKDNRKESMLLKYGVDNPMLVPKFIDNLKLTSIEKYGSEYPTQNEQVKSKIKKSKLSNHGSETYNNRQQAKNTCINTYGVSNVSNLEFVKSKKKDSLMKSYGVDSPQKSIVVQEKTKITRTKLKDRDIVKSILKYKKLLKRNLKLPLSYSVKSDEFLVQYLNYLEQLYGKLP